MKEKNTIKIKRNELAETVFATLCSDPPLSVFYTRLYKSRQNLLFLFYINDQIQLIQL